MLLKSGDLSNQILKHNIIILTQMFFKQDRIVYMILSEAEILRTRFPQCLRYLCARVSL